VTDKKPQYGRITMPKKLYFQSLDDMYVKLKNKLVFDGVGFSTFMRTLVQSYIDDDPRVIEIVAEMKEKKNIQSYPKYRKISIEEREAGKEIHRKFMHGLTEEELDKVYDFISNEEEDIDEI